MKAPGSLGLGGGGALEKSTGSFAFWEGKENEASRGRVDMAGIAERSQYNPAAKARESGRVGGAWGSRKPLLQESSDIDSILNGRLFGREQPR